MNFVFVKKCYDQCVHGCCHDWLIYATKRSGKTTLRSIDENGTDALFNGNIMGNADTRIYASGNGKYLGILTSNDDYISRFKMYLIDTRIHVSPNLRTGRLFARDP